MQKINPQDLVNDIIRKEEREGTLKSMIEAPRWAGASKFIKNLAWELGLELQIEVDKGFIRETVRYKVSGTESKLRNFQRIFEQSCAEYQNR